MLVNWFTTIAQIINFLILVWLLKRFLYGPIVRAMRERESGIASTIEEADRKRESAERQEQEYRQKIAELQQEREHLLREARDEADARRKELIQKAREEADSLEAGWKEAVSRDRNAFLRELKQRAANEVCAACRRSLADLADADLESQMLTVFLQRLREWPALTTSGREGAQESASFRGLTTGSGEDGKVTIRSAFEIAPEKRKEIERTLNQRLKKHLPLEYRVSEEVICGIELTVSGHKVSWSLNQYVEELSERMAEAFTR
jgi:F-type H+-transporting ATPase subunit b